MKCPECHCELREEQHGSPHPGGGFILCYRHPSEGTCKLAGKLISAHGLQETERGRASPKTKEGVVRRE